MNAILKARHIHCNKYRVDMEFQEVNNAWIKLELAKEIFANVIWLLSMVRDLRTAYGVRSTDDLLRIIIH